MSFSSSPIAHVLKQGGGASSAIDTTGADFLIAAINDFYTANPTVSDSKGNTWNALTKRTTGASASIRLFWCVPTSVGSGHTFQSNGGTVPTLAVAAFSGAAASPADQENGNTSSSTLTSHTTGSITPSESNCLVVYSIGTGGSGTITVDSPGTIIDRLAFSSGVNYGTALAFEVQTSATARNATFSFGSGTSHAAAIASFKAVAASDTIAATDLTANRIYQRAAGTNAKTISFAGTYTGTTPSSIEVKIVNAVGGATAQDWTALSGATIGSGNWSGNLSVPQGGGYHFLARGKDGGGSVLATSSESSNYWGVGLNVLAIGQSNMEKMVTVSSSPPSPNTNVRMYNGGWSAVAGNGAIRLANLLNSALSIPVGYVHSAAGGTGLHADNGSGYWMDTSPGSPYDASLTALAVIGNDVEFILWHQGETDAILGTSKANYKTDMDTLYSRYRTVTGRSTSQLKFGCAVLGTITDGTANDATTDAIRQAHLEWVAATTGAFFAGSSVDMVRTDNYHWTAPYYERMARRYAQAVLKQLGIVATGSDGLKVTTASRTLGSADITVNLQQFSGGTGLTELDGTTDGGSVTGFQVSSDDFSNLLTISSTAFAGNSVKLTLSGPPGNSDTVKVRYQYGEAPSIANPVFDNTSPQSDTVGLPLQPTTGNVSVAVLGSILASRGRGFHHLLRR